MNGISGTRVWALAFAALLVLATTAAAGTVSKTVPFELDKWITLDVTDGPVTLHRIQLAKIDAKVSKSTFFRPGNTGFLQDVQIRLEYSNEATKDWEADFDLVWVDASGAEIDGYRDEENLDESERHDATTITLSTLKYGLERAKKLKLRIDFEPE